MEEQIPVTYHGDGGFLGLDLYLPARWSLTLTLDRLLLLAFAIFYWPIVRGCGDTFESRLGGTRYGVGGADESEGSQGSRSVNRAGR